MNVDRMLWDGGTPTAGCVDVFHHAAQWVIAFARDLERGRSEADVPGLILYGGQVAAMQVPLPEILAGLAGAGIDDSWMAREMLFWRQAIRRFVVSDRMLRGHHLQPGDVPPPGMLHHVELQPSPRWLPFTDIMLGLDRLASLAGVPACELHFRYHDLPMLDGITLYNVAQAKPRERDELQAELDRWRERSAKLIPASAIARQQMDGDGECLEPLPPELRGQTFTRRVMALAIGRTERQLRRWDKTGCVPTGRKWYKPIRALNDDKAVYDVEKNWPAMASMKCRGRDVVRDRQLAQEIEEDKRAFSKAGRRCGARPEGGAS